MIEDAFQLFTGELVYVGMALTIVGVWFAWPRELVSAGRRVTSYNSAQFGTVIGLVIALLGVVLVIVG